MLFLDERYFSSRMSVAKLHMNTRKQMNLVASVMIGLISVASSFISFAYPRMIPFTFHSTKCPRHTALRSVRVLGIGSESLGNPRQA